MDNETKTLLYEAIDLLDECAHLELDKGAGQINTILLDKLNEQIRRINKFLTKGV